MDSQRWQRIETIYNAALPLVHDQRAAYISSACEGDRALQAQVQSLLDVDDLSGEFLETQIFDVGLRILASGEVPKSATAHDADAHASLSGAVLDGRYRIDRRLGQGGVGVVYLAHDQKLHDKRVVVKVLLERSLHNRWVAQKFLQEKEALARVDHPGVVGILDAGELSAGEPYIVMQFVDGISLRDAIKAEPEGLDLSRVASILKQAGSALSAVHEKKIYHRDLKPENIMLQGLRGGEVQAKIVDFGIAKVRESLIAPSTITGAMSAGTILYMSPEQLRGNKISAASDIYSLGVIAYEMITGRRPFKPDTIAQLSDMQRAGVRVNPVDLRPRLPRPAQEVVLRALAFDPNARYQEAAEFGDALAHALLEGIEAGHPGPVAVEKVAASDLATTPAASTDIGEQDSRIDPRRTAMELGHVLFTDVVGYSMLAIDEQTKVLAKLQQIIRATAEFSSAQAKEQLIRLPTGDGMALVFFNDPEAPVRCALEISKALQSTPQIKLRMGIHSGPVDKIIDVNDRSNVAGAGINLAQRVMDCGDSGHILLSKRVADDLGQYSHWQQYLHDLGETEVKHGVCVHVVNLHTEELGNPELPAKFKKKPKVAGKSAVPVVPVVIAAVFTLALAVASLIWLTTSRAESSFTYSLTVQKMRDNQPYQEPFQSSGQEIFESGYQFRLNVSSEHAGYLYVFNEGADENGALSFTIIYPTPATNDGSAKIEANQRIQTNWNMFTGEPGTEQFWVIWSASSADILESARDAAFKGNGRISNSAVIRSLREFLTKHSDAKLETSKDSARQETQVRGRGEVLVKLVELEHR